MSNEADDCICSINHLVSLDKKLCHMMSISCLENECLSFALVPMHQQGTHCPVTTGSSWHHSRLDKTRNTRTPFATQMCLWSGYLVFEFEMYSMPHGPTVYHQTAGKAERLLGLEFVLKAAAVSWCLGKGGLQGTNPSLKWTQGDRQQQDTPDRTRYPQGLSLGRMIKLPAFVNSKIIHVPLFTNTWLSPQKETFLVTSVAE